jgi:hypothetical protein
VASARVASNKEWSKFVPSPGASKKKLPTLVQNKELNGSLPHHLRQLGDIGRDPPRPIDGQALMGQIITCCLTD